MEYDASFMLSGTINQQHVQHAQIITRIIPLGAQIDDLLCRILLVIIHVYKLNIYPQDLQGSVRTN